MIDGSRYGASISTPTPKTPPDFPEDLKRQLAEKIKQKKRVMLQTSTKTPDPIGPDEILETLLVEAGAAGELPTDEERLLSFLGLEQMSFAFMHELDLFWTRARNPKGTFVPPPKRIRRFPR
jgi:hypothetical protein